VKQVVQRVVDRKALGRPVVSIIPSWPPGHHLSKLGQLKTDASSELESLENVACGHRPEGAANDRNIVLAECGERHLTANNAQVSDGRQPPLTFDLSLSETAASRSLDRRVR
jgi:hypothetical protein